MIGYKCAKNGENRVIITLEIPDDAITNVNRKDIVNKDTAKYRTNKAIVREIVGQNGKKYETARSSIFTPRAIMYTLNDPVEEPEFDMNLNNVCSQGIHFFLSREVAETYRNLPRNGVYRDWGDDGRLYREYPYKNGNLDGLCRSWFLNGQQNEEYNCKDNKVDGAFRNWHMNGRLWTECTYKDGKLDGLYRKWYENGQLWEERTYKDGKLDGLSRKWHTNGELLEEYTYMDGDLVK